MQSFRLQPALRFTPGRTLTRCARPRDRATRSRRIPGTSGVDAGTIARAKPRRCASASRRPICGTWRTSPPRPSSPITTVSAATGASSVRARDRQRDREVGARLGDPHSARHAREDVVAGERDAGALLAGSRRASRAGRRRTTARPAAASARASARRAPAPRRTTGACPRAPRRRPSPDAPTRRSARNSALGSETGSEPVAGHLHEAELVGGAEAVLQRAQHAQRVMTIAFERQHGVDDVLERARARERTVLGDVTDEQRRDAELLREPLRAHARRRAPGATEPGPPGASGSCTAWIESIAITSGRIASACAHTSGSDVSQTTSRSGRERAEPVGAQAHLRGRLLGAHEQAARAVGRHRAERLQHERALAHAGLAADERDRTRDEPAAEHPVELGHVGGAPGRARAGRRRRSAPAACSGRSAGPRGRRAARRPRASPTRRSRGSGRATSATRSRSRCTGSEQVFVSWRHCSRGL